MKINRQCRWIRRRLPLLAGGELEFDERRKVERHLIVCPGCRACRDSSTVALAALRTLGEDRPAAADAPSLWPALARQIRQSRHAAARPSWWEKPLPRPWGLAGLATAFGVVMVASIAPDSPEPDPAPVPVAIAETAPPQVVASPAPMAAGPEVAERPRRALPDGPRPGEALTLNPIKPVEPPSATLRFDYDLDHGTPMTPGSQDPQRTF